MSIICQTVLCLLPSGLPETVDIPGDRCARVGTGRKCFPGNLSPSSCWNVLTRRCITSLNQIAAISLENLPICRSAARGPRVMAGTQATPRLQSGCNYRHAAGLSILLRGTIALCSLIIAHSEITRPEIAGGGGGWDTFCPHVVSEEAGKRTLALEG